MVGQGNLVVVAVLDAVVGLVYQQIDLVILVNDNECVCVVAVVSLQLLSLGRSSVVSNVIVLINVDDYGIGYNLTSSDAVSGAAVEGQTLVRTNQLAGIRPVIADCNVAWDSALAAVLPDATVSDFWVLETTVMSSLAFS
mgnify:CR=1 FL=1